MFSDKLRELRRDHHLTQAQLAEELGISPSAVGMYEQGRREPDNAFLVKLSSYFGVSTDYLLDLPSQQEVTSMIDSFTRLLESHKELFYNGHPLTQEEREKLAGAIRVAAAVVAPQQYNKK